MSGSDSQEQDALESTLPAGSGSLLELDTPKKIHVIGVGGAGMSSIAVVLAAMGHVVSGSDLKESPAFRQLASTGVEVVVGHQRSNVAGADIVTYSTAIPDSNVELREAREQGIAVYSRADTLAGIARTKRTIAVAGTHGKTTTSSMLALILMAHDLSPSFIIGGELNEIGGGAVWDRGEWLVVEADESDGTFLHLGAEIAVVTNVQPDHLDRYGSFAVLEEAFDTFLGLAPLSVVGADDPVAASLAKKHRSRTAGLSEDADLHAELLQTGREGSLVEVWSDKRSLGRFSLAVPGLHNVKNAIVATATALAMGVDFSSAARALERFTGVARRFEFRGEQNGVVFVDDYAHLPAEVEAALKTARSSGFRRIVAVFQPHRFTRISALWRDFSHSFDDADITLITDIYGAGESPIPGVTGRLIADAVQDGIHSSSGKTVLYLPGMTELITYLVEILQPGDLCLTMGAGDITSLPDELMSRLAK